MENFINPDKANKTKKIITNILDLIQDNNLTYCEVKEILSSVNQLLDMTIVNLNDPRIQKRVQNELDAQVLGYRVYQCLSTES